MEEEEVLEENSEETSTQTDVQKVEKQQSVETSEDSSDTYYEMLFNIDEKLGLLLEKEATTSEEEEEELSEEVETLDYTEILTTLDTNLSTLATLYEEESVRTAEKEAQEALEEEPEEKDYTGLLLEVDQKLDTFVGLVDSFEAAADSVVTYSVVYIPLGVIIVSLYWFFSQFINRFY